MRILTVLARHGVDTYSSAEEDIRHLFDRQLPGVEREVIVVDNALRGGVVERRPGRTVLGGDNTVREFTAFDRALAWAESSLASYDLVHFATSAFNTLYTSYLDRFTPAVLSAGLDMGACIGHIDCYNEPVEIQSFLSQHWIRTGFFFLRPAEVLALGTMVSIADGREFFSGDPSSPFRPAAPLSATYRQYIADWLTGRDIGQGVTWHSRLSLTSEGLAAFEQKALSIMNEHLLGIRLRELGCPLIDVTWLAVQLARHDGTEGRWFDRAQDPAHWIEQLANRDRDAVTIQQAR
jgi:hypothetical protein